MKLHAPILAASCAVLFAFANCADASSQQHRPSAAHSRHIAKAHQAPAHRSNVPFGAETAVAAFIADMHAQHGFDSEELQRLFASIHPNEQVLRAIAPAAAPEQQRSWQRYRARFVNARRIDGGLRFWQENAVSLRRAEADYGVPPEIVVAIIGVETEYGTNTGRFGLFEALATLAFHYPPRAAFFRDELAALLVNARDAGADPLTLRGSYAGASGIAQFMPSSIRRFAIDYDGDRRIDLAHSPADAIGSVARYLAIHGWQAAAPVALPALVEGDPAPLLAAGIKPTLTLAELARRGILTTVSGNEMRPAALVDLVTPDEATEYWAAFDNFWVITRYNRSSFYAMAVFQLAEALRAANAPLLPASER
ncbi:lytic murein transglycosylase B [Rhodocyclus tenuis]|uniref:lytic murein transglycosylase B n=1 Tax=Rhodocyclus tenuis TaxID=1066 RepID=UPI001F5B1C32|nr:lytic murein transglycosylase B [Rhodocyclus tenuis]